MLGIASSATDSFLKLEKKVYKTKMNKRGKKNTRKLPLEKLKPPATTPKNNWRTYCYYSYVSMWWKKLRFQFCSFYSHVVDFSGSASEMRMHQKHDKRKKKKQKKQRTEEICGSNLKNHYVCSSKQYFATLLKLCGIRGYAVIQYHTEVQARKKREGKKTLIHTLTFTQKNSNRISRWLMELIRNNNRIIHI